MANFTPIALGAAANAAVVNAPLYELDAAITYLQSIGAIAATRPWGEIGGLAQPTSSTNVPVTAHITHTGNMVRGATTITSTGANFENRDNFANGSGNHLLSGHQSMANGAVCAVGSYAFATGQNNTASGNNTLAAGSLNIAAAVNSSAIGSTNNVAAGSTESSIGGGYNNSITISSVMAHIAAGSGNGISASSYTMIGAGTANIIQSSSNLSFIGAGTGNNIYGAATGAFVGAGTANLSKGAYSFIGSGGSNLQEGPYGFIGAGFNNRNQGEFSSILSGYQNSIILGISGINPTVSTITGGQSNKITDTARAFIGAGQANEINLSDYASVLGGFTNTLDNAAYSVIAGGNHNSITGGTNCFIGGGSINDITGSAFSGAAIIGGVNNTVNALNSTVLNGSNHNISGHTAVAGGLQSLLTHNYAFMWNATVASYFSSAADGEFAVTAQGGIRLFTNTARSTGMTMAAGASSWSAVSSRALKGMFNDVKPLDILERLLTVPIQTWKFKKDNQENEFHEHTNFGPVAEDWNAAFADLLGEKTVVNVVDGKELHTPAINEGDKLGVALAAIQGLAEMVKSLSAEVASLKLQISGA